MKIDPDCLRTLRQQKRLTRAQLADRSGITERTIQRLENESQRSQKTHEHTLNSLAKALGVKEKPGVLTGDLPLPESDKAPVSDPERVQIGAQIAPKTRLAYDLIKHRYGVNATEIINMAPLFFALLAEGSLARRRKKLQEAEDAINRLDQMRDEVGHWIFLQATTVAGNASEPEKCSIAEADIFGEHLLDSPFGLPNAPFDPLEVNPFVHYLRKLASEPTISDVVDVDKGDLNFRSQYKFPDYEVCTEELDHISQGSSKARRTFETGHVRLSEIPEELMAEDAGERRVKWLEDKLPAIYDLAGDSLAEIVSTDPKQDLKQKIEDMESKQPDLKQKIMESQKVDSQKTNSETEKEGDDE